MRKQVALLLLVAALCCPCSAFRRSDWTLADPGLEIEPYAVTGAVPSARSLALSSNSKPNGPWITYASSMSFDASALMNVRACPFFLARPRRRYAAAWPAPVPDRRSDPHMPTLPQQINALVDLTGRGQADYVQVKHLK